MKPDKIDRFLEGLLEKKEITDLRAETKKEVLSRMRRLLLEQTEKEIFSRLSREQAVELAAKMEEPGFGDDEVAAFLNAAGVNIDEAMDETMVLYQKYYLEEA